MRKIAALVLLASLSGCDKAAVSADPNYDRKVDAGVVALAAEAPDGTKLWAVTPPGSASRVYFASSGTSTGHQEACGKACNREVADVVPTAGTFLRDHEQ